MNRNETLLARMQRRETTRYRCVPKIASPDAQKRKWIEMKRSWPVWLEVKRQDLVVYLKSPRRKCTKKCLQLQKDNKSASVDEKQFEKTKKCKNHLFYRCTFLALCMEEHNFGFCYKTGVKIKLPLRSRGRWRLWQWTLCVCFFEFPMITLRGEPLLGKYWFFPD